MIAPGRADRPGAARSALDEPSEAELDSCPFCEGREDRTPPETFAVSVGEREPDTPGWLVRVVPNLYPAFERQEVVIHTPRHVRSFADLTDEELEAVAVAWRERASAARTEGFAYVHALVNEGREAGASLPHTHSQLVWLREEPPAVSEERPEAVADLLELRVAERDGLTLAVHPVGAFPYQSLIAPLEREANGFSSERLPVALALLREAVARLRAVQGPLPWNAWLHDGPHWHVELVPRLTVQAGIELGAGIAINTLAPEEAAERLREA